MERMEIMIQKTNLRPQDYMLKDVVRIINPKQCLLYIKSGIYPIDLYTTIDEKTDIATLAMIFLKKDTTEVYKKWCNYELK